MTVHRVAPTQGRIRFYTSREKFGKATGLTETTNDGCCFWLGNTVWLGVFDGKPSTLVHELVHALIWLMGYNGLEPKDSNGEFMAYAMDNAFDALVGKL